ncbi:MAG: insulinase family protein [Deltaproteobacteria bacterium]|nr:insulinase family protein [Deltaproteobacteria bacterium]
MKRYIFLQLFPACFFALSLATLPSCGGKQVKDDDNKEVHRLPPTAEEWRKARPLAGEAAKTVLPVFQRAALDNGLSLFVVEEKSLPIVDVRIIFRGGADQEPAKKAGLASIVYDLLDEGAGKMDTVAFAEAQEELGTRIHSDFARESGYISMGILKRNLDDGMGLMKLVVQNPRFNKSDFSRIKKAHQASLVSRQGSTQAVAYKLFAASLFGEKHPYGHSASGTKESLSKLKISDVKKFWSKGAGPENAALVFTGDISLAEAKAIAEKHFGKWKSRTKSPLVVKDVPDLESLSIKVVPFPGAAQTMVIIGRPLFKQGDPDEVPAMVFNQILGGMFSSRLNMNLREDKHYTYGASSYVDGRLAVGPFLASASIEAKHTKAALIEFLAEFEKMAGAAPSAEEMTLARDNAVKSLPARFETIGAMGNAAENLFLYNLDDDFYQKLPEKIAAVTAEDVLRVAKRACKKEGLHIILVGPPEKVLAPIEEMKLGDFEKRSAAP